MKDCSILQHWGPFQDETCKFGESSKLADYISLNYTYVYMKDNEHLRKMKKS
jgi:hypothetical protein